MMVHSHMEQYVRVEDHAALKQERDSLNSQLLSAKVGSRSRSSGSTCFAVGNNRGIHPELLASGMLVGLQGDARGRASLV